MGVTIKKYQGGIPTMDEPFNTHFPFQRPLQKGDKWERYAYEKALETGKLVKGNARGTYDKYSLRYP